MLCRALQLTAISLVLQGANAHAQTDVPATDKAATSTRQANQDARDEKPGQNSAGSAKTPAQASKSSRAPASPDGKTGEKTGESSAVSDKDKKASGDADPAPTQTGGAAEGKAPAGMQESKMPASPAQPAGNPASQGSTEPTTADLAAAEKDVGKISTEALEPKKSAWPFGGMRGAVDRQAAQRGFQIYSQVCSVCHSMNLVSYRDLTRLGFSEAEIKAVAAQKQVADMNDNGETVQRPGKPFDHFVPPYPNEKASRAANNGAYPPDLSLIIKAREEGPDYVHSLLTGFGNPPAGEPAVAGKYYNPYFQGHWISMPPPLREGAVTYQDGTKASVDQMAGDVVNFLQWAAEPEMDARHEMGLKVLAFLVVMAGFFYAAKKRVWRKLH